LKNIKKKLTIIFSYGIIQLKIKYLEGQNRREAVTQSQETFILFSVFAEKNISSSGCNFAFLALLRPFFIAKNQAAV